MNFTVFWRALLASLLALLLVFGLAFVDQKSAEGGMDSLFSAAREPAHPSLAERIAALPPFVTLWIPRPVRLLAQGAAIGFAALEAKKAPPEFENAKRV